MVGDNAQRICRKESKMVEVEKDRAKEKERFWETSSNKVRWGQRQREGERKRIIKKRKGMGMRKNMR